MERYCNYTRLVDSLRSILPPKWTMYFLTFPRLALNERKSGITLYRARQLPSVVNSSYDLKVAPFLNAICNIFSNAERPIELVDETLSSPDVAAFSLSLLLSAPYTAETVYDIFSSMVLKEMQVLESVPKDPSIHWHNLMSYDKPLSPDFRSSPYTNRTFRSIIARWISYLQDHVIYPYSSTRTLSKSTTRKFNQLTDNTFDNVSPLQLEQLYAEHGTMVESPCEMRQVWYPTQATPRTYYAMGGTAYYRSRYLRDIFNVLADFLPSTNRYTRVQPSHLSIETDESVLVYDLVSFTSLFHEQRFFLDFIAHLLDGIEVIIFDTHTGFQQVLVSDLVVEYNLMNKQPSYSMERMWDVDITLCHSVAGFLGVYANLITCTIPHGLCLMTLRDAGFKSWCAGDDGGVLDKESDEAIKHDLSLMGDALGRLQKEKVYDMRDGDVAVALKRRLVRYPGSLHLQANILFPPFSVFFAKDPRFDRRYKEDGSSDDDPVATFCSGLMSMFYQMSLEPLDGSDISFLKDLLPVIYQHLSLPREGFFPPLCGHAARIRGPPISYTVPRIYGEYWKLDPNRALLDAYMPSSFHGVYTEEIPWDGSIVEEWTSNSDKLLSVAVRMGYLEREEVRVTYSLDEEVKMAVYREFLKEFRPTHLVYRYRTITDIPAFYSLE